MTDDKKVSVSYQITIIGILFFIFGFITWANGTLIPYLKIACELNDTQQYYVATAFFAAYFIMAIPSSMILKKTGFKSGMSVGLFIMAIGALLFIPAAQTRTYNLFLLGLFIIGTGLALLQTAANPFVTVLGPIESAAQRISIMGICNKIAGICAIYVLGSIALKNADEIKAKLVTLDATAKAIELDALASRVIQPYTILAIVLSVLAIAIYFVKMPEVHEEETNVVSDVSNTKTSIFQFPHLLLGAVAIFFYVGVEVISYDTFANFGEHLGYPLDEAKNFPTYTGYALLVGYVFNIIAIPKYLSQQKTMLALTILSMVLVLLSVFTSGKTAIICFMLLGFSNAVMWPAIWPLAIDGLGKFTKIGSAFLIMGIVGGAILPPLYGKISQWIGNNQTAYLMMIPCYLYILYYTISGHQLGKEKKSS
ncbi:MAG TPA: sugar MFS transporter [Chitinophagales bacterium]|jgi:FHS family L-fucose permease-like MFS transporter|nr:sugar MFS transporter [Chitinophagales bacterium]MBP6155107.1 sugar MFS transporter [Chitinophagales bacterium]HQV78123.1 sugar MFS transporter [Chitinophagales bacterium]HQW79320.1 sugar MFS transporter [Chitinophagales bacterium]HRB18920.1 sugar MFS transporter [Chitinophagales bacterium]